jgi:hypothetical protein
MTPMTKRICKIALTLAPVAVFAATFAGLFHP